MSRSKPNKRRVTMRARLALMVVLGLSGPMAGTAAGADRAGHLRGIKAEEQDGGRTRVVIAASVRPSFTTWKMEHPSRVVVDVYGVALSGSEVPFDAGTFAVGNVSASASGPHKARVILTLRQGADYDVKAQGNDIVVEVTPWEAPPKSTPEATPSALAAARKAADEAVRARAEAEARAKQAEAHALTLSSDRNEAHQRARRLAEEAARARAEAHARAADAEAHLAKLMAERQATAVARQEADEAARARAEAETRAAKAAAQADKSRADAELQTARARAAVEKARAEAEARAERAERDARLAQAEAEARAARAEAEARRLAEEKQQMERARREAAEHARQAAERATQSLAEQQVALEDSRTRAESAQREAARLAKALADERAALERARQGAEAAQQAADSARRQATEGKRRDEQRAAELAAARAAREQTVLEQKRQQAEAAEKAAALALAELATQKQDVEARQKRAELARLSAVEAAKRLEADRQRAAEARAEAERLRTTAEATSRQARVLLAAAEAAQKSAEARQSEAERRGQSHDAEAARLVREARTHTEEARAAAERARQELARLDDERKQLAEERESLSRQQAALAEAERLARVTDQRAAAVTAKAAEVASAMARLQEETLALASQKQRLAAREAALAEAAREAAVQQAALAANAAAQKAEERRLGAFESAVKQQQDALTKARDEQAAQQARLRQAEETLAAAQREIERRQAALVAARKAREAEVQSARAGDERARHAREQAERDKLAQAQAALERARAAHAEAEAHRGVQEQKLGRLVAEREALEASRNKLEAELASLKGELASARAEVARLKAMPAKAAPVPTPTPDKRSASAVPVQDNRVVAAASPRPRSVTLRVPSRVSRIDFVDEPARSSVIIDLEEPIDFSIERSTGRRVTLRLHHADLPHGLERSLDATQYFGPVRLINSFRAPGHHATVLVEVELAEMVPNRIRTDGARLYWDFDKHRPGSAAHPRLHVLTPTRVAGFSTVALPLLVAQDAPLSSSRRPQTGKKRFTGRRIDLDFKGADIHNILRLLAEVGGVNIVTSDDVKGEVTIKMRDVPWDQALDVVLRAKSLGQVREGNLIRVAPIQVLEKELEQEIAKQKQMTEVMPTETRLIGVSYADAKDLEARAKDLLSGRGKVSVDDRTNNLIVSDVAKNLSLVEELVRNLDTQTSQVVIEARIVEARSTFVRQLGVQWGGAGYMDPEHGNPTGLVFPNAIGVGGGATDRLASAEGLVPTPRTGVAGLQSPNYAVNLPAAVGTGSGGALGLTLGSVAGALNLNVRLSALEQSGQVRILSSPRISTMDNVEASIEQGVAIPISVVSAQGVQTVFVDAKLNLTVKPHVTNEGTVIMNVHVTRNEPDFVNTGARGDPTILKKEAKTVMLVRDGDTAVIGGIYQRNSGLNYNKVPFFADIPIVGFFFRSRRENDDRTEFLVFITPRISNRSRALAQ